MIPVFEWALLILGGLLLVPCSVFSVQCLLSPFGRRRSVVAPAGARPRIAILMPAHDEAEIIEATLSPLLPQLRAGDRLLVVADNCSDNTADLCRAAGAEVVERQDLDRRGKGYALVFGLAQLAEDPPDVVVIVDADCLVEEGALTRLAHEAVIHDCPVQADYVLSLPERPSSVAVISALAFIVKNRVRPLGMAALGMPCPLTGTGMAFPYAVLRKAPPTEGHLVEDMVMGIELALLGHAPRLCADAHVLSGLPSGDKAAKGQRRRWEHGHMATIREQAPRLLAAFFRTGRLTLLGMALDLLVPPLALLVLLVLGHLAVSAGLLFLGGSALPLALSTIGLLAVGLSVMLAWAIYARHTLPLLSLLAIPFYILWKIPLYLTFLVRGRHDTWERTDRAP